MPEDIKFSIVVPSYNQSSTLEATLKSIFEQDHQSTEIIVIDGGSTDGSVEILKRWDERIDFWVSEPDRGQSHAINKGFQRTTGDIIAWVNSDDTYRPGTLSHLSVLFADKHVDVVAGRCQVVGDFEKEMFILTPNMEKVEFLPASTGIPQPSVFMRRKCVENRGFWVREDLHYAMDVELWSFLQSSGSQWKITDAILSNFYLGDQTKTSTGGWKIFQERAQIYRAYGQRPIPLVFFYRWCMVPLIRVERRLESCRPLRGVVHQVLRAFRGLMKLVYGKKTVDVLNWEHLF